MKTKTMFKFLTIIFSSLFAYVVIFFLFFLNLDKKLNSYDYISNDEVISFYKKYSNYMHHLREVAVVKRKNQHNNVNNYIFDYVVKNQSKKTILLQGDSWFQQIYEYDETNNYLKKRFKDNFQIINSGSVSYSPSIFSLQYTLLKNFFNIKPDYIFIYIDQTDLGDENCRYKYLKNYNSENQLISIPYEKFPYYSGMNIDKFIQFSEIKLKKNKYLRNQYYINYKTKKAFYKIIKSYQKFFYNKSFAGKCPLEKIQAYLINNKTEEVDYFKNSLIEYFDKLKNEASIEKIFIITHPHYYQLVEDKYKINVSTIIDEILINYPNFEHINFSKKIYEKNLLSYYKNKSIWLDLGHLKEDALTNLFLKEIIDDFYRLK